MRNLFTIDKEKKEFVFTSKHYQALFNETSEEYKAFKAAMALGCYEGYVPVEKKPASKKKKSAIKSARKDFTEGMIVEWLKKHNPEWVEVWKAAKEVKAADGNKFSFMTLRNYFLYCNPEARAFCGIDEEERRKADPNYKFKLTKTAAQLQAALKPAKTEA